MSSTDSTPVTTADLNALKSEINVRGSR